MSTCKDCKHWGKLHPPEYYDSWPTFGWKKLPCEYEPTGRLDIELADDCAVAAVSGHDGGTHAHEIYTGPDFGCIHWEPHA